MELSDDAQRHFKELTGFDDYRPELPRLSVQAPEDIQRNNQVKDIQEAAATMIQSLWKRYVMKKTYKWMRYNLYMTYGWLMKERMLTKEMLKRITPNEANLLLDRPSKIKVRFRFGGSTFPPKIMYKIYTSGMNTQYFSGHDIIFPGSQASEDAFTIMGSRSYTQRILLPDIQQNSEKISKAYEVTDKLEYIQYISLLDKKAPFLGGRNNDWRELKLSAYHDQNIYYSDSKNYDWKGKNNRAIDKAYKLIEKHRARPKSKRPSIDIENHIEEEFGLLLDWAEHLDEENLFDYDVYD